MTIRSARAIRKDSGDRPGEGRVRAILAVALEDMTGVDTADQVALAERLAAVREPLQAAFRRGYDRGPKPPQPPAEQIERAVPGGARRHAPLPFSFTEQQYQLFSYGFNLINDQAVSWAEQQAGELIVEIVLEQLGIIRGEVADAVKGNRTSAETARSLRNTVGLHSKWARAVVKYEDRQYVQLIKEGKSPAKARQMAQERAQKYAANLTRKRAKMIARTEIMSAENAGHMRAVLNGVDAGYVNLKTRVEWITAEDELTCPVCRPMNGVIIELGHLFELKGRAGNRPHPPAHPNCRCTFNELPPDYAEDPWWNELKPNATTPSDYWPNTPGDPGGARLLKYSDAQPRDYHGRWTEGGYSFVPGTVHNRGTNGFDEGVMIFWEPGDKLKYRTRFADGAQIKPLELRTGMVIDLGKGRREHVRMIEHELDGDKRMIHVYNEIDSDLGTFDIDSDLITVRHDRKPPRRTRKELIERAFNPAQPRDDHGRWTSTGYGGPFSSFGATTTITMENEGQIGLAAHGPNTAPADDYANGQLVGAHLAKMYGDTLVSGAVEAVREGKPVTEEELAEARGKADQMVAEMHADPSYAEDGIIGVTVGVDGYFGNLSVDYAYEPDEDEPEPAGVIRNMGEYDKKMAGGIYASVATEINNQWIANTNRGLTLAAQDAVARNFEMTGYVDTAELARMSGKGYVTPELSSKGKEFLNNWASAQYANTQLTLMRAGVKDVKLYRGIRTSEKVTPGLYDVTARPLSSWSTSADEAARFGAYNQYGFNADAEHGYVLSATVPAGSIFSLGGQGPGYRGLGEVVVLHTPDNSTQVSDAWDVLVGKVAASASLPRLTVAGHEDWLHEGYYREVGKTRDSYGRFAKARTPLLAAEIATETPMRQDQYAEHLTRYADHHGLTGSEWDWPEDQRTDFALYLAKANRVDRGGKPKPRDMMGRFARVNTLPVDGTRLSKATVRPDNSILTRYTAPTGEAIELVMDEDHGFDLLGVATRQVRIGKSGGEALFTFHEGQDTGTLHAFTISAANQDKGLLQAMIDFAERETGRRITASHVGNAAQ